MPLYMEGSDWTAGGLILGLDLGTGIDRVHILGSVDGLVILEAIIKWLCKNYFDMQYCKNYNHNKKRRFFNATDNKTRVHGYWLIFILLGFRTP